MAVTMQDVARLAGCSIKTVSNVVNDFPNVTAQTRSKVLNAIEELGYEVNLAARHLRTGKTGLITLALPELRHPYFAELAHSIIAEAEKHGLRVLVEQTNADRARELDVLERRRHQLTDGVLFSPLALSQADIDLFNVDFPLVLLGERVFGSAHDHVTMSNVDAAAAATRHLLKLGRTKIALIGADPDEIVSTATLREQGFRQAMDEAGVAVDEDLVRPAKQWRRRTGLAAIEELLASGKPFDAVFALNDPLAMGVLHGLHVHRVEVPKDVAVIGFDDVEESAYTHPTLTTMEAGRADIAREAVARLLVRIQETSLPEADREPIYNFFAPFSLTLRDSTPD